VSGKIIWRTFVRGLHNVAGLDSPYAEKEYGPNWSKQRGKCLKRDNSTCRVCGATTADIGRDLSVHHITPRSEFDDNWTQNKLENLVTLCPQCHGQFEGQFQDSTVDEFVVKAQEEY
jgi:5-methylcytosine-specific restriction endonuclease McrA